MLRFRIRTRPRKMASLEGLGSGPEGRLQRLRKLVTSLIRNERLEGLYAHCSETRGYAERLITMAVRNGDRHRPTMEMADYWLSEKDLIHKLFKVLVPRYQNMSSAATSLHRISTPHPGKGLPIGVLELKGNPLPPVRPKPRDPSLLLSNVLIDEARRDFHQRLQQTATTPPPPSPAASASDAADSRLESSVDGTPDSSVDPVAGTGEAMEKMSLQDDKDKSR